MNVKYMKEKKRRRDDDYIDTVNKRGDHYTSKYLFY